MVGEDKMKNLWVELKAVQIKKSKGHAWRENNNNNKKTQQSKRLILCFPLTGDVQLLPGN